MNRLLLPIALLLLSLPVAAQVTNTTAGRIRSGTATPATCSPGQVFMVTGGSGATYQCLATNTWTIISTSTGGTIPLASLPTIPNSQLQNSSIGVTAGTGLSGGGVTSLGSSATLNLDLTYSPTWTGNHTFSVNSGAAITQSGASATNSFAGDTTFTGKVRAGSGYGGASTVLLAVTGTDPVIASQFTSTSSFAGLTVYDLANTLQASFQYGGSAASAFANQVFLGTRVNNSGGGVMIITAGTNKRVFFKNTGDVGIASGTVVAFSSTSAADGTVDAGLYRNAAGVIEVNSGTANAYRDLKVRQHFVDQTITAGGTTGNQTINKAAGTVNVAAAGTSVTVTNSLVTTSSTVYVSARTNDSTCAVKNVVPGSGSFVINLTAACTAETSFGWLVVN